MSYSLLRTLLFKLEPERAHALTLSAWQMIHWLHLSRMFVKRMPTQPIELFGLTFPNCLGIAAGLDKNADYLAALFELGVGFIEVGGVTPEPQPGNAKPRLFRILEAEALINRMGFNSLGVEHLVTRLQRYKGRGIVGVNLAKQRETALGDAVNDYQHCYERVYPYASFATINISSPNTPGLRELGSEAYLENLIKKMKNKERELQQRFERRVPLLVKISIDIETEQLKTMLEVFMRHQIDGVVCSNTSTDHSAVSQYRYGLEPGGLSGPPIHARSVAMLQQIRRQAGQNLPIIGVGGIDSAESAQQMLDAGANLVQLYTGLVYHGPKLINKILALIHTSA